MYFYFKRVIDFILACICMPIVIVVILVAIILIKLDDGGKIFYIATRVGRKGKTFRMYKLRSMKENAKDIRNEDGSTYNCENDDRVTKVGKFLRKTSLDEIPQIINVLIGDMSFVGPRPDTTFILENGLSKDKIKVLSVRPGITGYNQVVSRNLSTTEDKLNNDLYYVDNCSLLFDIKIIIQTFLVIFTQKNIYRNKEKSN